ncbi:sugar (glycoside-pentoside-hexuronide) transporter [Scytonema sp. HK-05]|uniref:MFS transporter n=1 Tax=Scytonema sp. HK-05 TaxID=1137095 RepID=UPI000937F7B3|nr:MFS transporter [Scytonema sp. HK-05]OKH57548.1 MFS transporter [Scytonema sp. HK-05]BAY46739.1 sugar (glycoside-pentoside-hexuronide) transporter [Scytonema sp. HK-05]
MSNSASDGSSQQTPESEKLDLSTKLAFGAGDLGTAITAMIGISYLSPFLTDVAGLNPQLAGQTQLVGKVWDAVNDPMVGVLSDRTQTQQGRRYPWMIWGAIPFGVFFFLQWIVPHFSNNENANQWGLFWYYTAISILFNTFYTIVNLPYTALTAELTQDYDERTSLNGFRFTFSIGGSILALVIGLVISFVIPSNRSQQFLLLGAICAIISVLPVYWCVWGTKKRAQAVAKLHPQTEQTVSIPLLQQLKIAFTNRPFLFVVGIYLCSWLAVQLTAGIIPYFVTSWMRLPQWHISLVLLAVQGTAMSMLFVWSAISRRYGKQAVYFMGMSVWMIAQSGLFFVQPGQVVLMYVLAVLAGFGVSTAYLVPWSMLPDVIELDELNTGQRREGIFYSFIVFVQKICLGIAVNVVLQRLGTAGYIKPTNEIPIPIQPDSVLEVIRFSIGPIPAIALISGLVLTYFYPLTREMHAQILLKLKERQK